MTARPSANYIALSIALCGLLLVHAQYYLPFIADDALISLRYAQRLADGHGLSWTDGQRVEGFSNPLWVLLLAGARSIGLDLIQAARGLGLLFSCAAISLFVWHVLRRGDAERDSAALALSGCFFALAAPVAVWSVGGLEQPLVALSLAVVVVSLAIYLDGAGGAAWLAGGLVVLSWARPDGVLFALALGLALAGAHLLGWRRLHRRDAFVALAVVAAIALQLGLRLGYYGEWIPNTARVKLHPSEHYLLHGLRYVGLGWRALLPTVLLAFVVGPRLLREPAQRVWTLAQFSIALCWSAYLVVIGGDIFPAYRHFVPIVVVMAFVLAEGMLLLLRRAAVLRSSRVGVMIGLLITVGFAAVQFSDPENRRALDERWEFDGKALGLALKKAFGEQQPTIAVSAAGCLPYWSELPAIDMLGLNDAHIARATRQPGYPGHEMGDGAYVLDRRPDIVVFSVGAREPGFPSGKQMVEDARFARRYVPVRLELETPRAWSPIVWMDRESEAIGPRRVDGHLTLPAYLLATVDGAAAVVGAHGDLELKLEPGVEVRWTLTSSADAISLKPTLDAVRWTITGELLSLRNAGSTVIRLRSLLIS